MTDSIIPPLLKIYGLGQELSFALQEGFSEAYTNSLELSDDTSYTHPLTLKFKGGHFDPMKIDLDLFVGVGDRQDTLQQLRDKVLLIQRMAMKQTQKDVTPPRITIRVGTWFSRKGYIKNVTRNWLPPFDTATGESFHVKVCFTFESDFANSYLQKGTITSGVSKLPQGKDFEWSFDGA